MKKIFTLFALGALTLTANAQEEKLLFEFGATYVDEQEFTTENTTLQLGKDIKKAEKWDNKATSTTEYLAPFTQIVQVKNEDTGDMEDKERIVYILGANNPKDDLANKGGGFNGTPYDSEGNPREGKLPQSGTYYKITPSVNGTILAGIILNGDKEFFIVDATDAVQTPVLDEEGGETGNYTYNVVNIDAVFTHDMFKICDSEGNELPYQDEAAAGCIYDGGKGGVKVLDKITGTVEFDVKANRTYYVFCTGSKLSFFGYVFTPSGDTPVEVPATLLLNGETIDGAASLVSYEWLNSDARYQGPSRIEDGAAVVYVRSQAQAEEAGNPTMTQPDENGNTSYADWDSQFFITFGEENALQEGDKLQLKMQVKSDVATSIGTQLHNEPGVYVHWFAVGDVAFSEEWAPFESPEVPISGKGAWQVGAVGTYTIAFNLAKGIENTFYFKDIQVLITRTATGITKVIDVQPANGIRYNLAGQRVDTSYKGVVLQNGKKYINK
ncbi:MAG: hypothetical protein IKT00_04680 [Prevotella sp.]|nr:hypothetical protein [Prevotella sp.]